MFILFADIIWVILNVEENGLLGLTQQMSNISSNDAQKQPEQYAPHQLNPFASPVKDTPVIPPGQISPVIGNYFVNFE